MRKKMGLINQKNYGLNLQNNMKEKYYWKVVSLDGRVMRSATWPTNDTSLVYKLRKTTKPEFGKIFVFNTRENARDFKKERSGLAQDFKILKVKATDVSQIYYIVTCYDSTDYKRMFWNKNINGTCIVPTGTFVASSVTPVQIAH